MKLLIKIFLTGREIEVLQLMAAGRKNHEISLKYSISEHTAKSHATNIFNKLNVNNRGQAAVIAAHHLSAPRNCKD